MLKHAALSSIQRIPFYASAAGTTLCIILSHTDGWFADMSRVMYETGVITAGFWIIYVFSVYLGFCTFQRLGIYYSYLVFLCVWLRRYPDGHSGFFGQYLDHAHIFMSILGLIYLSVFIYRQYHRCRHCPHK